MDFFQIFGGQRGFYATRTGMAIGTSGMWPERTQSMFFGGQPAVLRVSTSGGSTLALILSWLRTFFQRLAIPYPAFAGETREFEILREFEGIDGAGVFAEAAEHA